MSEFYVIFNKLRNIEEETNIYFHFSDNELAVFVQGPRPENILLLIHEVFESLIHESFHGVMYDFSIPCPDCITKEVSPSMV